MLPHQHPLYSNKICSFLFLQWDYVCFPKQGSLIKVHVRLEESQRIDRVCWKPNRDCGLEAQPRGWSPALAWPPAPLLPDCPAGSPDPWSPTCPVPLILFVMCSSCPGPALTLALLLSTFVENPAPPELATVLLVSPLSVPKVHLGTLASAVLCSPHVLWLAAPLHVSLCWGVAFSETPSLALFSGHLSSCFPAVGQQRLH